MTMGRGIDCGTRPAPDAGRSCFALARLSVHHGPTMNDPKHIPGLEVRPMGEGDRDAVRDVIADAFSRFEPMAVAAGQTYEEFQALVGLPASDAAVQELTVCARLAKSGDIVGVMLATDFTTPMPEGLEIISPGFAPIGGLLAQLDAWYDDARAPQPGECLHLAMLAVDRAHWGNGIAQNLVAASLANGKAKGYRTANTFATNRVSQRVFENLGFSELFSVSFKDYTFEGNRVFASIERDDRTALMERVL
jgi:predicted N-acetyltransferase YhbS